MSIDGDIGKGDEEEVNQPTASARLQKCVDKVPMLISDDGTKDGGRGGGAAEGVIVSLPLMITGEARDGVAGCGQRWRNLGRI